VKQNESQRVMRYLKAAAPVLAAAAVILAAGRSPVRAADSDKIDRQIEIFEKVVDAMLVDSPNFLVSSGDPSTGHYLEDRGAVFSFRTSLVGEWDDGGDWWRWLRTRDDDDDDDDREWIRDKDLKRQERRYERGKVEISEMLLDFGELLTGLGDNEVIEVRAKLRGAYFRENDLRRFAATVKMADVRAYSAGTISEEEALKRIKVEES